MQAAVDREKVYTWILELCNPETRENALLELSKKREVVQDLAPMLWHSFGTIAALLQEITNIYVAMIPPTLTAHQSNRVCNALALMQCVASHPETRSAFLQAHVPLFLYPFLHTVSKTRPFEYLRLTSLGVIGALVKTDEQEINFVMQHLQHAFKKTIQPSIGWRNSLKTWKLNPHLRAPLNRTCTKPDEK
ncbi:unnamed protein product, partial [Iphiclides podalirius]